MAASEIEKLERLVRENPKGRLFASLADAYRKDGQFPKALEVLEAGLKNHPDYVSARVVLGRVHMTTGDRVKAREAFSRVVELDPESVIALKALADLAEEEGESNEALRWSGQLLTVDPGNDDAMKQQERLTSAAKIHEDVRLSGIVPVVMEDVVLPGPVGVDPEATVRAFPAITGPIPGPTSAPTFNAAIEPLERAPEPLPLAPLSEEAQVERTASEVRPMAALEPTSYEDDATDTAPTERMAGIDPTGLSDAEVAGIGATSGFEPTSGPQDMTDLPRTSVIGLETISGDLVFDQLAAAGVEGLEREQDIELGGTVSNEFQEDSVAETLRRRSGANEFQVPSDADTLNAASARASEAIETGGIDLAFIEPDEVVAPPKAAKFTPAPLVPEELEPAVAEPEPVVTEAMADLYASQGHLAEALNVYRQLSARSPADPRYADRIVELEMFVGGSAPTRPESARSETVDSLDQMEIVAPTGDGGHAPASAPPAPRITVGVWLADVFAEALPAEEPAAPAPAPAPVEAPPVSDVAPRGAPTRPASGSFSLSNVFGEERPGKATAKSGSFDDFFGSPAASPPAAPSGEPGRSTTRSTRPSGSATPPADDDLSSFQDWLKGLKK